jgi:putative transcriptional regulator
MSNGDTTRVRPQADGTLVEILPNGTVRPVPDETDWQRLWAMSHAEVEAAALADPDAQPISDEVSAQTRPVPRVKTLRRALGLTQEAFSARYQIPLGTLRDWEQARTEPDQPARAYLRAIAGDPEGVRRALESAKQTPNCQAVASKAS